MATNEQALASITVLSAAHSWELKVVRKGNGVQFFVSGSIKYKRKLYAFFGEFADEARHALMLGVDAYDAKLEELHVV